MQKINRKKILLFCLPLLLVAGAFLFGHTAAAISMDSVGEFVGSIIYIFIYIMGRILAIVIHALIWIASYQNFIGSQAVILGWAIVRDICNMFFVVVLMIIAFGTILHLENYNYKKWLPKLVLMAILINFSKTICGLLIDVSQVVMLTFVNAFKDVAGGNMIDILGIQSIVTMAKESENVGFLTVVGAYLLGLIYLIIAVIVIVTMLAVLVMRLVMIWIYVVLSPFAYLLAAFPGGEKYSSQWWSEFIKNLIVGPILAFFIWLSFAALQTGNYNTQAIDIQANREIAALAGKQGTQEAALATEASTPGALIKFVIAIGMLIGGLKIAQEVGGAAGSMAGKGMAAIQKGQGLAMAGIGGAALLAKRPFAYGVDKLHEATGVDLNLKRAMKGVQEKRKEIKEKRYATGQLAAREAMESGGRVHGILAMTGNSGDAWEQMTSLKGIGKRIKGGRMMARLKEEGGEEKRLAEKEENRHKNELEFMSATPSKRDDMRLKAQGEEAEVFSTVKRETDNIKNFDQEIAEERSRSPLLIDEEKIAGLEKKRQASTETISAAKARGKDLEEQQKFMGENYSKTFSGQELEEKEVDIKKAQLASEKAEQKIEANIPEYSFEARATEQHAVSAESSKIKDITDPSELLRVMQDAIKSHDKTMVKAIALKMTKEGNDNEFLKPLAGRTDHVGLKDLMRQFSDKNSKNYAGFGQQEAFGLGSQVAELNKNTNHWGATSAYTMENGQWRETTDKEHNEIRDVETGKQQLQSFVRNNNRLAYGYHDDKNDFHLDTGGILKLQGVNNEAGHKNIETMNESAAKYVYDAIKKNKKLETEFSVPMGKNNTSLMSSLEARLGKLKDTGTFEGKYREAQALGSRA